MHDKILTLFELNSAVKEAIERGVPGTYLVTAEISSFNLNQNGHCYLELAERSENAIIAKMRATIWSSTYRRMIRQFSSVTGTDLRKGLKILARAEVNFHELYGLSLNITDIDPSYTLGEMALKRKEILERLTKEGLANLNKDLEFPLLPVDLAIISSPGAAGYEDFLNHIDNNPYGYFFRAKLFSSVMQGEGAEPSILRSLKDIMADPDRFDLIIIIRGGGGEADLHCFDSYEIGKAIAKAHVPVISGIGHQRDRTIVDEIAHISVKTPTAAAGLVIQAAMDFESRVALSEDGLIQAAEALLAGQTDALLENTRNFGDIVMGYLRAEEKKLDHLTRSVSLSVRLLPLFRERLVSRTERCLSRASYLIKGHKWTLSDRSSLIKRSVRDNIKNIKNILKVSAESIRHLDPGNVLKRGYSITSVNGKLIKDSKNISPGDIIETKLFRGSAKSRITEVK